MMYKNVEFSSIHNQSLRQPPYPDHNMSRLSHDKSDLSPVVSMIPHSKDVCEQSFQTLQTLPDGITLYGIHPNSD